MDYHLSQSIPIIVKCFQENPEYVPRNRYELELSSFVLSRLRTFETYKEIQLHTVVKQLVPWESLSLESSKKMLNLRQNSSNDAITIDSRDLFLIELLSWFKKDFFSWFQTPNCERCVDTQMVFKSTAKSNREEQKWLASSVELYSCPKCNQYYRFARYNHPVKLLETKTGRCGEWMNCFTALCVVFNYEVRSVIETGDHVWLEVYSESQQKWMHCDPCENAIDTPLMYEAGWNKKLSYCVAISDREMQDVTWTYTYFPNEVLQRRAGKCREDWLIKTILFVTRNLQNNLDPQIVREMNERRIKELVSFIWLPNQKRRELKSTEMQGRQSGSIMWRVARGEFNKKEDNSVCNVKFTFKPCMNKLVNQCYSIKFNSVKDEYNFDGDCVKGWQNCVYLYKNICKKVEQDWKMTYLSRIEDSVCEQMGLIAWEIDLKNLDNSWKFIEICLNSKIYETGSVKMYISSYPEKIKLRINENEKNYLHRDQFPMNCSSLSLTVELSGGKGSIGWQQAQLFRQSLINDCDLNSMEIIIKF